MKKLEKIPSRSGQIIYGPVHSRRIGVDIGINLLVQRGKTCNFNCVYCQYGKTKNYIKDSSDIDDWVSPDEVEEAVSDVLKKFSKISYHLDAVTFSGFGEPTLHPEFDEIVSRVSKLKNEYYPNSKLTLITNSAKLSEDKVIRVIDLFDNILAKLDTAFNDTFHKINNPADKNLNINDIIESLKHISKKTKHLTIQTLIFDSLTREITNNTSYEELEALADAICSIKPNEVQIYTIVREGALEGLVPASSEQLNLLKKLIDERCGDEINAKIY